MEKLSSVPLVDATNNFLSALLFKQLDVTNRLPTAEDVAPAAEALPAFLRRLAEGYRPGAEPNRLARGGHCRGPPPAGLGAPVSGQQRAVGRLFSDAAFGAEGLAAGGLWSMSRGLARREKAYKHALAAADAPRLNDYDGRGNLSEKRLAAFCRFFLEVALDQVQYMGQVLAMTGCWAGCGAWWPCW